MIFEARNLPRISCNHHSSGPRILGGQNDDQKDACNAFTRDLLSCACLQAVVAESDNSSARIANSTIAVEQKNNQIPSLELPDLRSIFDAEFTQQSQTQFNVDNDLHGVYDLKITFLEPLASFLTKDSFSLTCKCFSLSVNFLLAKLISYSSPVSFFCISTAPSA